MRRLLPLFCVAVFAGLLATPEQAVADEPTDEEIFEYLDWLYSEQTPSADGRFTNAEADGATEWGEQPYYSGSGDQNGSYKSSSSSTDGSRAANGHSGNMGWDNVANIPWTSLPPDDLDMALTFADLFDLTDEETLELFSWLAEDDGSSEYGGTRATYLKYELSNVGDASDGRLANPEADGATSDNDHCAKTHQVSATSFKVAT